MEKNHAFWEIIGYVALAGTVLGQIVVGYWYLFAQCVFLFCNVSYTIRCFAIKQNNVDKVKNITFTAITIGLIIIRLLGVQTMFFEFKETKESPWQLCKLPILKGVIVLLSIPFSTHSFYKLNFVPWWRIHYMD